MIDSIDVRESTALIRDYLTSAAKFWPKGNQRQVDKLDARLSRHESRTDLNRAGVIDQILTLAACRSASRTNTLFLVNAGSSGSHWIETMLAEFSAVARLGEVYFPPKLRRRAKSLGPDGSRMLMHSIHLAHGSWLTDKAKTDLFISSAHVTDTSAEYLSLYRSAFPDGLCVLLCRDPYDIVVSRAFRKDEYRKFIAVDMDDDAYLNRNIDYVKLFYCHNLKNKFDARIRYEDFRENPHGALQSLLHLMGVVGTKEQLRSAIERHDRGAITSGQARDSANLFQGDRVKVSAEHRSCILKRMEPIRLALGYQPIA